MVRDMYETYEVIASEEGDTLSVDVPDRRLWIWGDPNLIRQLVANLLANAVRHAPRGSSARIALADHPDGIALAVSGNGTGIPEAECTRVLERFYRLEKSRTTVGSGLGLSMVKAICDLHDARIELADNRPGLSVRIVFSSGRARE